MCMQCISVQDDQPYSTTPTESKLMRRAPRNMLMTENGTEKLDNELITTLFKISRRLRNYTSLRVLKEKQQKTGHPSRRNVT